MLFFDGNKRIGIFAMLVFLELNQIVLECSDAELVKLSLGLADGSIDYNDVLNFIYHH